jgi:hypothetical protein
MRGRIVILITAAILAATLAGSASGSSGFWHSNTFVSPTRNIVCQYYAGASPGRLAAFRTCGVITCMTRNNGRQAAVSAMGGRGVEVYDWPDPFATPFTPTLYYGQTWHANASYGAGAIQCLSSFTNMACRTSFGHGFSINRAGVQTW